MNRLREWTAGYRPAAIALLGVLWIVTIYRGITQSISHDEAVMFEWFQAGTWSQICDSPFGNHHPLTVLLGWISVRVFGLSEFSQRLPSLIGAGLYFYSVLRLCALLLGDGALLLLGVAFLSLNPFLLDYLCLARGYCLGLAFFMYAVYQLILYLSPKRGGANPDRILNRAGVAMGLAIACNVIMIFPAGAVALAFFVLLIGEWVLSPPPETEAETADRRRKGKKARKRTVRTAARMETGRSAFQAMIHMAIPAVVVAGVVVTQPRKLVQLEEGYLGPPSLFAILQGIVEPSLLHSPHGFKGLAALSPGIATGAVTYVVVPALLLTLVIAAIAQTRQWMRKRDFNALSQTDRVVLLLGITLPAALSMVVASRYLFGQPYPEMRTVLYWIPLLGLAALALAQKYLSGGRSGRIGGTAAIALMVLCVVQYATQFNTRYFAEWAYCAATRDMMQVIRTQHASGPEKRVRVGANWELEPGINFYRVMWRLTWMNEVYRESPDGDYDYYLLLREGISLIGKRHLTLLFRDELSNTALAKSGT